MAKTDVHHFWMTLPLFGKANPFLVQKAVQSEHAHVVALTAGDSPSPAFEQTLGVVLSGNLHILSADTERSVVLRSITRGHIFGAASLFSEKEAPVSRLVAHSACALLFLTRDAVRELLRADDGFLDAYLQFLAERVDFLNGKIRAFTAGSTERRLALWLAEHAENGAIRAVSLSALAEALDIGRASLYRALDKMESEGLITRNGREINVPCAQALLQKYHS